MQYFHRHRDRLMMKCFLWDKRYISPQEKSTFYYYNSTFGATSHWCLRYYLNLELLMSVFERSVDGARIAIIIENYLFILIEHIEIHELRWFVLTYSDLFWHFSKLLHPFYKLTRGEGIQFAIIITVLKSIQWMSYRFLGLKIRFYSFSNYYSISYVRACGILLNIIYWAKFREWKLAGKFQIVCQLYKK